MRVLTYPYPEDAGWTSVRVISYLRANGARLDEAVRWIQSRIPSRGTELCQSKYGVARIPFFDPACIQSITKGTIAAWQREEAERRAWNVKRDLAMQQELDAQLDTVRTAPVIVIKTDTTGLVSGSDEILELVILDTEGQELFASRFRPLHNEIWLDAENVNHIRPEDVQDERAIDVYRNVIQKILSAAKTVIGYNVRFETAMLKGQGFQIPGACVDVMESFAAIYGAWDESYQEYTWQKLKRCAHYYHYDWNEVKDEHRAMAYAKATLYCWKKMQEVS
jgi:DNA polymerase-3 subunit epsilon